MDSTTDEDKRRGAILQALRHASGLSAPELHEKTRVAISYIYALENGRKPVVLKMCRRLAAFYGVPVEMITDPGYQPPEPSDGNGNVTKPNILGC